MLVIDCAIDQDAYMPEKAHKYDAGYDIRTPMDCIVRANSSCVIDTGVHMLIPPGYCGFLKSKSGLNVKSDLTGEGVIDAGYTGSIVVKLYSNNGSVYHFNKGDKIIQIVILPIPDTELKQCGLDDLMRIKTERGANGFGSTGK